MMRPVRSGVVRWWQAGLLAAAFAVAVGGCSRSLLGSKVVPAGGRMPVSLRNFEIASADGHRAVLLRLSGLPTLVRHSSASHPGRILIQAWGAAGEDLPERRLAETDAQIAQVRVSRHQGALNIILDFHADQPPAYSVREMADWIMVRFAGPRS
jgi:hypothetical protein